MAESISLILAYQVIWCSGVGRLSFLLEIEFKNGTRIWERVSKAKFKLDTRSSSDGAKPLNNSTVNYIDCKRPK